jgi:hypothetical protein
MENAITATSIARNYNIQILDILNKHHLAESLSSYQHVVRALTTMTSPLSMNPYPCNNLYPQIYHI